MSQTHSFATPAPAGLGALAMACFCFYALLSGKVTPDARPILACWMVGGGIVQLATGLIELKDHNLTGGNVFTFFAAFFMFATALSLATKYGLAQAGLPMDTRIEGWGWLAGTGFLIAMTPNYLKSTKLLFLIAILLDVVLICITVVDLQLDVNAALFANVAAWSCMVAGWIAIYLVAAVSINANFGRMILPIPSPIVK
ncbi:GPR1/FUN34/YaaH family transporter [Desulfosarcina sp. OttesenSCG-928-G10]|nr:GPR1/FUN34/YaaH family transporter [Desulfosarcina sp. OttesenSCG-928-G10]MDL2320823.1 GPR1/FUN34/YaaH family transporter [Desulfosarcina sp. OttesenSCG-928-B08]